MQFRTQRKRISEFSLAGLTDIVLLLLVFFLLISSIITYSGLPVNLPESRFGVSLEQTNVTVTIDASDRIFVGSTEVASTELLALLKSKASEGTQTVIINADRAASVGQFVLVASAAKGASLNVRIATEARQ